MIFNLVGGSGGGAALNFKIISGTTQPTSAAENTIWVNTDTTITEWVFSSTEPTDPVVGMVWFPVGTVCNTPINAIKENGLWVYPYACQQYIGGVWVNKTAKVYQSGIWKDVRTTSIWLFNHGDLGESGGYQSTGGTLEVGNEISFNVKSGDPVYATAENEINLSGFSTITYNCYLAGTVKSYAYVGVGTTRNAFAAEAKVSSTEYAEVSLDISNLEGFHYVGFRNNSYSSSNNAQIFINSILIS